MPKHHTITLWQPYASFIAWGIKHYETRGWKPHLETGSILMIHAAKRKLGDYERRLLASPLIAPELKQRGLQPEDLPMGCIVAATRFQQALSTNDFQPTGIERIVGNYQPNRYAWQLELIKVPEFPILATGKQGIWIWEYESEGE